jgi:hypothetical protein
MAFSLSQKKNAGTQASIFNLGFDIDLASILKI